MTDDPMHIPDRDLKLIAQASAGMADKLMWAYRLGRQQGKLEGLQDALDKLQAKEAA